LQKEKYTAEIAEIFLSAQYAYHSTNTEEKPPLALALILTAKVIVLYLGK